MKKEHGFTLIELMIAIAILAIVLGLGVPSFGNVIRDNRTSSATNDLVGALQFARSEAIRRHASVTVAAPGNDWKQGWSAAAGGTTLRQWDAPALAIAITGSAIIFTATGRTSAALPTTFELVPAGCTGTQRREVSVTATGSVRAERQPC